MLKIDRLLLVSFIPPFLVTFGIATFVLLMQILWVYIDDIAGKGLGAFIIVELLSYKAVGLVPMALPLAILISGVMVMGGLAEHYELSSFKSAGVSLLRVMRPIMVFGAVATGVSYLCSDLIIPAANLQFGSRMYDITQKKPTLNMEAGVFNDDFGNFVIRIGEKGADGISIKDVMIYDHTDANSGRLTQVIAESGEMYATADGNFFIMQLFDGHQYIETQPNTGRNNVAAPFVRTAFKSWNKVFDMSEFNLSKTDQSLFSMNRSMMSISQLSERIDTIQTSIDQKYTSLAEQISIYFHPLTPEDLYPDGVAWPTEVTPPEVPVDNMDTVPNPASTPTVESRTYQPDTTQSQPNTTQSQPLKTSLKDRIKAATATPPQGVAAPVVAAPVDSTKVQPILPIERFTDTLATVDAWLQLLPNTERQRFLTKAKSSARAIMNQAEQTAISLDRAVEDKVKHIYELHTKYSMALVCIIFVFIGAPLGAIVRKGGFGYPMLVSIVAFIFFIVLTIFCRKIAETLIIPAALAAWLPCIILSPIGLWLTLKARSDSKLVDLDGVKLAIGRILDWARSRVVAQP